MHAQMGVLLAAACKHVGGSGHAGPLRCGRAGTAGVRPATCAAGGCAGQRMLSCDAWQGVRCAGQCMAGRAAAGSQRNREYC